MDSNDRTLAVRRDWQGLRLLRLQHHAPSLHFTKGGGDFEHCRRRSLILYLGCRVGDESTNFPNHQILDVIFALGFAAAAPRLRAPASLDLTSNLGVLQCHGRPDKAWGLTSSKWFESTSESLNVRDQLKSACKDSLSSMANAVCLNTCSRVRTDVRSGLVLGSTIR